MEKIGRLTLLQVENLGILKAMSLSLDEMGNLIRITGPNGAGKSWAINSILYGIARGNKIPDGVIKDGTAFARIKMKTGEGYTFTRVITQGPDGQKESLDVTKDGAPIKGARAFLDSVSSEFMDPSSFIDLKGNEVYNRASAFFNFSEIDSKIEKIKTSSSAARAERKAYGTPIKPELPWREITGYEDLKAKKVEAQSKYNEQLTAYTVAKDSIQKANDGLRDIRNDISALEAQLAKLRDQEKMMAELVSSLPILGDPPSDAEVSELTKAIDSFAEQRLINASWDDYLGKTKKIEALEATIKMNDDLIEEAKKLKDEAMRSLGSVSFADGSAFVDGRAWELCSTSQKILASIELAAATIPEGGLRVLYIHRGESIGSEIRSEIIKAADKHDLQIFMEVFDEKALLPEDGVVHIIDGNILEPEYSTINYKEPKKEESKTTLPSLDLSKDDGMLF
jgi:DNA repair exonuclease SbcCD ATPase subunit